MPDGASEARHNGDEQRSQAAAMARKRTARARCGVAALIALAVACGLTACDESYEAARPPPVVRQCALNTECPSGTECGGYFIAADSGAQCPNADGIPAERYQSCRVAHSDDLGTRTQALFDGFDVERLPSTMQREGGRIT